MRNIYLAIAVLMGAASTAFAQSESEQQIPSGHEVDVALSNDTLEMKYVTGGSQVGVENSRFAGAFFLSEDRDIVLSAGLTFPLDFNFGRLSLLAGPQVYAALLNEENNDVMAVSVGAELRFVINEKRDFAIAGHAYYAPDILTFGSADNLTDFSAQAEIAIADRMKAFAGMRWFELDLTEGGGTQTLQDEVFVGLGYRF